MQDYLPVKGPVSTARSRSNKDTSKLYEAGEEIKKLSNEEILNFVLEKIAIC